MPTYDELIKYSNPAVVAGNAVKYFGKTVPLFISSRVDKKYMIQKPDGSMIHFGGMPYQDFTYHQDTDRRDRYLKRASHIRGQWRTDKYSANNLSMNILWV